MTPEGLNLSHCTTDRYLDSLPYAFSNGKQRDEGRLGERELWLAVIRQAMVDVGI